MSDNKRICKYCGKEFDSGHQLGGHMVLCKKNPSRQKVCDDIKKGLIKYRPTIHTLICACCGKEYELLCTDYNISSGKYKKTCSSECSHKLTILHTDQKATNLKRSKTLHKTLENKPIKTYNCKVCGKKIDRSVRHSELYCSDECMKKGKSQKLSIAAKRRNFGGYNEKYAHLYNRSKRGWYKGIFCSSSWELAFVIYHLDHHSNIKRCEQVLKYYDGDNEYKYYPDFEIDGVIYEIKGYKDNRAVLKEQQFPEIVIIDETKIRPYLDYAIQKFGRNFVTIMKSKNGNDIKNNINNVEEV